MIDRIMTVNRKLNEYKLTATGGFAIYIVLCTITATIIGTWSFLIMLAQLLYPLI